MKVFTPEISWHNRLPALSLDISRQIEEDGTLYRVATGGNDCRVYIWLIRIPATTNQTNNSVPDIRIAAGLRRHQKSVGAVRFSNGHMLASGDDDGYIYLWKHKLDEQPSGELLNDDGFEDTELWKQQRVLRGHIEDICDLTWSKDSQFLLSGSVDNSAILWDTIKGTKIWCSDLIKGYVQGVALDPHCRYMAALSSDRTLRVYNFDDKRLINATRQMNIKNTYRAFFCDDTVQTFCRRFEFSPDGQFLAAPTARMVEREPKEAGPEKQEQQEEQEIQEVIMEHSTRESLKKVESVVRREVVNTLLVFKRSSFNKPSFYYPTGKEVALCVKFSPIVYVLRKQAETNFWGIPYRIVFAVATSRSILLYDSQQSTPIGYISQVHLARITDIAWSGDGRFLMVTSYDGYSTLVTFEQAEFGQIFTGELFDPATVNAPVTTNAVPATKNTPASKSTTTEGTLFKFFSKRSD